ncbi:MAG: hypothetical protein Q4C70_13285 [Planctomycetia bacterium]|nr:hypothetical protein [Planctomycetia bacterium]
MIIFNIEIDPEEIATYISSRFLPDYFRNMKLEQVHLEQDSMNRNGTQPLMLTYTRPGRVEDFAMNPDEHAFPLIQSIYPEFQCENAMFIEHSAHWMWDEQKMRIIFRPREVHTEPSGEVFSTEDVYVSISRREIFLSFEAIHEFLIAQFTVVGLPEEMEGPVEWDSSQGAIVYRTKRTKLQWVLAEENALDGILHFLGVDCTLQQLSQWVSPKINSAQLAKIYITDTGLKVPLVLLKEDTSCVARQLYH